MEHVSHSGSAGAGMPSSSSASPDYMPGMASTFSINTHVTLWFTEWTITTPGTYFLTLVLLFSLGIFNRFLGALRSQLERKWNEQSPPPNKHRSRDAPAGSAQSATGTITGHVRMWSRAIRSGSQSKHLGDLERDLESEPLSPAPPRGRADDEAVEKPVAMMPPKKLWMPSAPWSLKEDGIRAMLEFAKALIGYILMLAVMTYNVGFFFAVTGSVLLGELIFGRYTQGPRGWQEGGCHE